MRLIALVLLALPLFADFDISTRNLTTRGTVFMSRSSSGQSVVQLQNNHTAGYSAIQFNNSSGTNKALVGWLNSAAFAPSTLMLGTFGSDHVTFMTNGTAWFDIDSAGGLSPLAANSGTLPLGSVGHRWSVFTGTGVSLSGSSFILNGATLNLQAGATFNVSADYVLGANNTYAIASASARPTIIYTIDLDVSGTCTGCPGAPTFPTTFSGTNSGGSILKIENFHTAGYSSVEFLNSSGSSKGLVGYANSAAGVAPSSFLIGSNGASPVVFYVNGVTVAEFETGGGFRPIASLTYPLGDASHKWSAAYISSLETYGSSHVNSGSTLNIQSGGTLVANAGSTFTVTPSASLLGGAVTSAGITPLVDNSVSLGDNTHRWFSIQTFGIQVWPGGAIGVNGNTGLTVTKTVRNSAGSGTCTLDYDFGVLTGGTC